MLLQSHLIDFLARQSKFVQRQPVLDGERFAAMMIFAKGSLADTSLWEQCEEFYYNTGKKIRKQSLHERFNENAVAFLKLLLENVLDRQINMDGFRDLFPNHKAIKIKDSTSFQLPEHLKDVYPGSGGATSKACIKIQFEYNLKSGTVTELSIGGFTTNDLTNSYQSKDSIEATDLLIRDLGYIGLDFLSIIQQKQAFFLNRIKSNVSLWKKNKEGLFEPLGLAKIEKQMRKSQITTMEVSVYLGKEKSVQCRLIIECLPPEKIAEKLRKAKRAAQREGRILGKDTLSRIGMNLFVTNMDEQDLPLQNVWLLYRLRWQIELVFKVFKSIAEINKIKKVNRYRFECYLYGKLIWALLGWDIYWKLTYSISASGRTISINKMMKSFRRLCWRITSYNEKAMKGKLEMLEKFIVNIVENCMLEKRKGKLSSIQIVEQLCAI